MKHQMIFIIPIVREKRMSNKIQDKFRNVIAEIVNEEIIEKITGNQLTIIESKNSNNIGKNKEVRICHLPNNCVAFKTDLEPRKIYLFKQPISVNDELLLKIEEDKITVFIIELKSNDPGKAKRQIRYGKKYADFLIGILELEMKSKFKTKEYRGYVFTTNPRYKKPVIRSQYLKEDKNDTVIDGVYIKFFGKSPSYDFRELGKPIEGKNEEYILKES